MPTTDSHTPTWLAIRSESGALEPLGTIPADELERLALQAGLMGRSLSEWLTTLLEAAVAVVDPPEKAVESLMGGRCVEIPVSTDLRERLVRMLAANEYTAHYPAGNNFTHDILCWLRALSETGLLLQVKELQEKGIHPECIPKMVVNETWGRWNLLEVSDLEALDTYERHQLQQRMACGDFRGAEAQTDATTRSTTRVEARPVLKVGSEGDIGPSAGPGAVSSLSRRKGAHGKRNHHHADLAVHEERPARTPVHHPV